VSRSNAKTVFTVKQLADLHGINSYDLRMMMSLVVRLRWDVDAGFYQALDSHLQSQLDALPWQSIDEGGDSGLTFYQALFATMAGATPGDDSLGSWLLQATARAAARFGMMEDLWTGTHGDFHGFEGFSVGYGAHGQRSHYGPNGYGLPAGLHWVVWNRDPNRHEHNGLVSWSGLTWEQKRRVAEIHFGDPDAIDTPHEEWIIGDATPGRIALTRMLTVRSMLKDSLTLCDWVFPNYCCPDPEREYAGDLDVDSELYRAVTGDEVSADELDLRAEGIVDLYRAITVRDWNTTDLRGAEGYQSGGMGEDQGGDYRGHDNLAAWYFDHEPHLDRAQFEDGKTKFYQRMGWHSQLGCPTRSKLAAFDQEDVADGLEALGLLEPDES